MAPLHCHIRWLFVKLRKRSEQKRN